MKLDTLTENERKERTLGESPFHSMLDRIDHEVENKSPVAGKRMRERIRSFKAWMDGQNEAG